MTDIAIFLAPVSDDDPVGYDLSYDDERINIEQAFETSASGEGANDVNWRAIISKIEGQAARTKDVWLAVYLARAGARMGNLETVARGIQLLAGLLEDYWDTVHPKLEDYGFQGRKGPCESLARIAEFIGPLRRIALIAHPRLGTYSAMDLERFEQGGEAENGYGMFRAAIEQVEDGEIDAVIGRLDQIRDGVRRVDAVLVANAGDETGTNFQPTYQALAQMRDALARNSKTAGPTGDAQGAIAATSTGHGLAIAQVDGRAGFRPGGIETRDDVLKALDAVSDYYRRCEPGSAVPLALQRAREWVPMTFLEVLADIAPDSIGDVKRVLVSRRISEGAD